MLIRALPHNRILIVYIRLYPFKIISYFLNSHIVLCTLMNT